MVSTTACGRPLKSAASHPGATHGGSTGLDAGAKWCRAPEKEVLPQRNGPGRGCREENEFGKPGPGGPERRDQQDLLLVLPDFAQCLCEQAHWGNAYLHRARGQLCASASVPRVPSVRETTTGSGRTREKQTGLPELLRIDSKSAGSSRDGVAILRGK